MKLNKKYLISTFIALTLLFISCGYETFTIRENENREDFFIIWSHSDIQPRGYKDREAYETAVLDVKENIPHPEIAIVAGDIIHSSHSKDDFEWFIKTRNKAGIAHWFEITGNHDMKDYENYMKYVNKPPYYSVSCGNLLLLFMSDEDRFPPTYISDEAFEWWKEMVIKNQDKIIITITHAYLAKSGLFLASKVESRTILNSHFFEDVLRKYRVDIWLSGHTHIPSLFGFSESRVKEFNNTLFINTSRIRRDMNFNPESRIIILQNNSDTITIKTRDHHTGKFIKRREREVKTPLNFIIEKNQKPKLSLPKNVLNK